MRARFARTPTAWVICVAAVAIAAGSSGVTRAGTDSRVGAASVTGASAWTFTPQLWRFYRVGGREASVVDVIDRAEQLIKSRCMKRAGFSYWPVQTEHVGPPLLDGLSDVPGEAPSEQAVLRSAHKQGFGLFAQFAQPIPAAAHANDRYFASLSKSAQNRYQRALAGDPRSTVEVSLPGGAVASVPAEGCIPQSSRTVYGSVARDTFRVTAVAIVEHLVDTRLEADHFVEAATARWASCLKGRSGHAFGTPGAIFAWFAGLYDRHRASQTVRGLEIRTAVASMTCMYQTGLEPLLPQAEWQIIRTMPASWYQAIVDVRHWNAKAVVKARAILRG